MGSFTNMNINIEMNRAKNAVGIVIVGDTLSTNTPTSGIPRRPQMTETSITCVYIIFAYLSSSTVVPMKLVMKRSQNVLNSWKYK